MVLKKKQTMKQLDKQIATWKDKLKKEIKIPVDSCECLASTIKMEIENLNYDEKQKIIYSNPIDLRTRIEELQAFQSMMNTFNQIKPRPEIVRTQVISQNYICFVYLKDTLFESLKRTMPTESLTKKCCKYLLNNPVRAFRNSIAHGNWKYKNDFSGIEFWAYKGEPTNSQMVRWDVCQRDLSFWQALSRLIAYVSFLTLIENE
jgi:hypothetical protein